MSARRHAHRSARSGRGAHLRGRIGVGLGKRRAKGGTGGAREMQRRLPATACAPGAAGPEALSGGAPKTTGQSMAAPREPSSEIFPGGAIESASRSPLQCRPRTAMRHRGVQRCPSESQPPGDFALSMPAPAAACRSASRNGSPLAVSATRSGWCCAGFPARKKPVGMWSPVDGKLPDDAAPMNPSRIVQDKCTKCRAACRLEFRSTMIPYKVCYLRLDGVDGRAPCAKGAPFLATARRCHAREVARRARPRGAQPRCIPVDR